MSRKTTSKMLPPKIPDKVNARVLWYTQPDDPTLDDYPELYYYLTDDVIWNVCTDIRELRAEVEKNDIIFIDGGAVGSEIAGDGGRDIRIINTLIEDFPNKQFVMSGYLPGKWYRELCEPYHNLDWRCWTESREYVKSWIRTNKGVPDE